MFKKTACFIICVIIAVSCFAMVTSAEEQLLVTVDELSGNSYFDYSKENSKIKSATSQIDININDFTATEGGVSFKNDTLETKEGSVVTWQVDIPEDALYSVEISYKIADDNRNSVIREFRIDNKIPFDEASVIELSRVWKNATEVKQDSLGNDLFQEQVQVAVEQTELFDDGNGFYTDPYEFYFTKGMHTVSLTAVQGSTEIKNISLVPVRQLDTYKNYLSKMLKDGVEPYGKDLTVKIQAEDMTVKSSAMLSAVSDRSSPLLEPPVKSVTKLNILGGGRFNKNGQWVEYEIKDIPKDGLYKLVFKAQQNSSKGVNVSRNIYINGEIPFKEAQNFEFVYSSKYDNVIFGNNVQEYLVYLKKGSNTLRIEASLGEISAFCRRVSDSLEVLNGAYSQIVTITGTNPDIYRDYDIKAKLPQVVETFGEQAKALNTISEDMEKTFNGNSDFTAIIDSMVILLERMYDDPYTISSNISSLSSNLSSLGSLVSNMQKTDLNMDYILIKGGDIALPKAEGGFFTKFWYEIKQLTYSFVADYNSFSATDAEETITTWVISGRDQSQILKQLIDSDFTVKTGVGVKLRLVSTVNTLLQATLAGVGPDVALNIPQSDIMNFAFRDAIADLNEFSKTEEICNRFISSSLDTLTYNDSLYGFPQTCTYPMLFYRADILEDLGLEVPNTWDDVYKIIPVLTQNHMSFGLPTSDITNASKAGVTSYGMLLYQRGGSFYDKENINSVFDSDIAIETMEDWVELYSGYGMPATYNFANRFASGEMPLAIADYSMFNTLSMFAPQIANLWGFTRVPGTVRDDGSINYGVPVTVTAGIILESSTAKENAYSFLDWWTSDEVQIMFGNFLESILGPSGRYSAANKATVKELSWNSLQYANLKLQSDNTFGIPEIPGGYYTWRYLDNSFREIIDDGADVREVMYSCNKSVNDEMAYQRQALGLN